VPLTAYLITLIAIEMRKAMLKHDADMFASISALRPQPSDMAYLRRYNAIPHDTMKPIHQSHQ
jgi:hypothetical protein